MAQKRMFAKSIIETDEFMDMPMSTKALYFLLGMEADDEGFVSPKRVMRIYGGSDDDLKVLISKKFVIRFESGVVVITDWKENNYLDKNRISETKYKAEKELLTLSNNKYELASAGTCLTSVKQMFNQYSIVENSIEQNNVVSPKLENAPEISSKPKPLKATKQPSSNYSRFSELWNIYPKRTEKKDASVQYEKLIKAQPEASRAEFEQMLLDKVEAFKKNNWLGKEVQYIKSLGRFLKNGCYEDEIIKPGSSISRNSNNNWI